MLHCTSFLVKGVSDVPSLLKDSYALRQSTERLFVNSHVSTTRTEGVILGAIQSAY